MRLDPRKIAVATAGFCAFLNLYSPQALLPALAREFGVGAAEISTIMTASALAIALTAPFTGAVADVLGRKRVITAAMLAVVVPMAGAALAPDVNALIVWRFIQGLLLPPIFAAPSPISATNGASGGRCRRHPSPDQARRSRGRFIPGVLTTSSPGGAPALAALSLAGAHPAACCPRKKLRAFGASARRGKCCGT
jgi:MFS family permease